MRSDFSPDKIFWRYVFQISSAGKQKKKKKERNPATFVILLPLVSVADERVWTKCKEGE